MKNKLAIFLPTRKGSNRVLNKNTKPFADINGGLLELKLKQLIQIKHVDEIILSTNDEQSIKVARKFLDKCNKLKIIERPDALGSDQTNLTDLIEYVATIVNSNHILWTHVTSPFIESEDYEIAIQKYLEALQNNFDSLMTVKKLQTFLWDKDKNDIINRVTKERWPKTQTLKPIYEIDSGIFIAPKGIYEKNNDRIGKHPFLYELDEIKSFDIDWPIDFDMAEILYEKLIKPKHKI